MGQVATYPMQGGQPSRFRELSKRGGVALPWGGPLNAGGDYPAMTMLQNVGGAAQAEIWTLTLGGAGTFNLFFTSGSGTAFTGALSATTTTAAQLLAALNLIWPAWVLPSGSVTGSAGGPFTITFGGSTGFNGSGNFARINGNVGFVLTGSATAALVRTQRGSVGAGQYDVVDGVVNTVCEALLVDQIGTGPTGDLVTVPFGAVNDTTFSPWAWIEGWFFAGDIPGLTNAIVASSPALAFYLGTSVTQPGAEMRLIQGS